MLKGSRILILILCAGVLGCGGKDSGGKMVSEIPARVLGGGGGMLRIELSLNQPGYLMTHFEKTRSEKGSAEKQLPAGNHSFRIDFPEKTYGYFEFEIPDAKVGANLTWSVYLDDVLVAQENETLQEPLKENDAFFLQFEFNDLDEVREYMKDASSGEGEI